MSGGINKVQTIQLTVVEVFHLDGVAFYGNASLPLQIHVVKYLVLKLPFIDSIGFFKQTIGQGTFTVVDVRYYTEIPDSMHPADNLKNSCKYIKL